MANRSSSVTLPFPIYDIGTTVEDIVANNVTVTALRDTVLRVGRLGVTAGGGANSRFVLDDCTIFMSGNGNNGFKQGFLSAKRSKLILTSNVRFVLFANSGANAGAGFNFDLQEAYLAAPNATTSGNGVVVHFGGAATTGTLNTEGLVFGPNAIPQTHPYLTWVNTTFSNSFSDAAGSFNNYTRFVNADADLTLAWSGFFGCDFTSWANSGSETQHHIGTFACPWEEDLGSVPTIFVLNCDYDGAITSQKVYNDNGTVGREARWVSGRAWKPAFSRPDGTDTSSNFKLDFGSNDVYDMQSATDQNTTPTLHTSSGGINVRDWRTDGWAIVEDSQIARIDNSSAGNSNNYDTRLDVAIAEKTPNVYAYEEETWGSDGVAQTVTTVASPFTGAMVLGDAEGYVFAATSQTSISKTDAENYRAGTTAITTIDHLVAAARKDGFDNTQDLLIYAPDAAAGAVTIPNATFTDSGAALSVSASTVSGNINGLTEGIQYNTLTGNVTVTSASFTLGDMTIDGDLTFNISGNNTISISGLTVTGDVTNAGSGTLTINASGSSLASSEAGTGAGQVNIVSGVTTITIENIPTGAEVRVYDDDGDSNPITIGTEREGVESLTGTSFQFTATALEAGDILTVQIMDPENFEELVFDITLSESDQTIDVQNRLVSEENR